MSGTTQKADGLQGDGENGLDGVSVSLYRDNGDGVFIQASDTLIGTETTQAGGRYLFQDVQPGGYFVDVVDSSVPAGFSLNTNNDPTPLITLAAEQSYRDADFGYASLDFGDAPGTDLSHPARQRRRPSYRGWRHLPGRGRGQRRRRPAHGLGPGRR